MKSNLQAARQLGHQANLVRYRRILATHLTAAERDFVERRVAEETETLERLAGNGGQERHHFVQHN